MKYIKSYNIFESSSAGSQDTNNILPFKYTKNYDPRIGYNTVDFIQDLSIILEEGNDKQKDDILSIISSITGEPLLSSIRLLNVLSLNRLISLVGNYLDSKSDYKLEIYPDGYVLCFENLPYKDLFYDIYYSPKKQMIKIVPQEGNPSEKEYRKKVENFNYTKFGITPDDYEKTLNRAKVLFNP